MKNMLNHSTWQYFGIECNDLIAMPFGYDQKKKTVPSGLLSLYVTIIIISS